MSSLVQKRSENRRSAAWAVRLILLPGFFLAAAVGIIPAAKAQAPANNNFSNAAVIVGVEGTFLGSNVGATRETNEPIHYVGTPFSSNSVWFKWTAPMDGVVTFDTIGTYLGSFTNFVFSSLDTVLAAYTLNGTNGVASLNRLASDDDSGGVYPSTDSLIRFAVTNGGTYYIALDGYRTGRNGIGTFNSVGSYVLNWTMGSKPPVYVPPDLIQFSTATYSVAENQFAAIITLYYGGDSSSGANGDVSVDFYTTNGTAIDGTNYLGTMGTNFTVIFAPGERVKTVTIPIINDFVVNLDRTVLLGLINPTNAYLTNSYITNLFLVGVSGTNFVYVTNITTSPYPPNAVLTIVDEDRQTQSTGGSISFSSSSYVGTENETFTGIASLPLPSVGGLAPVIRDVNLPAVPVVGNRSPLGVVVKVIRSTPAAGRVMVDYFTELPRTTNVVGVITGQVFPAKAGVDFFPTSGTLVFDDYQMSAEIVLPVYSNSVSNNASSIFDVVLTNPRPAPEELAAAASPPLPYLGGTSRATIEILEVNERFKTFNFERALYRYDEYEPLQNDIPSTNGVRTVSVDVILPGGGGGTVTIRMLQATTARYATDLQAGSDYATLTRATFFNTPYTDGTAPIVNESDFSDFVDTTLTFPGSGPMQNRQTATFTITNDNTVEFNEDVRFEIFSVPNGFSAGPALESAVTILFDDQPAGAADREWNPEGLYYTQPPFNNAPGANNSVSAVAIQPDNRTIIVGDFTAVNSAPRNHIARLNPNGSIDLSFNPGTGADDFITTVAIVTYSPTAANIGKIMIGGGFSSFAGAPRSGIARLNANGSLDSTFKPGNGADGTVRSIALQSDGKILVAGDFRHFNDLPVGGIMRLNEDGTLDTTFNPGSGLNAPAWSVAVRDSDTSFSVSRRGLRGLSSTDRNVIETGATSGFVGIDFAFGSTNNIRVYYDGVAILDLTTAGDTNGLGRLLVPYGPGVGTSLEIVMNEVTVGGNWFYTAAILPNLASRSIYVAGEFTTYNGFSRKGVAKLNGDGSVDTSFDPGVSVNGPVYAMAVQPNNRVLLGGAFTRFHDSVRNNLVRVLPDGKLDVDFHIGTGPDNAIYAITLQADQKIYLGGIFQSYNGTRRMGIARLFGNGVLDTSFMDTAYNQFAGAIKTFNFDSPRFVNSIALQADGAVMIGGSFDKLGGNLSYNNPAYAGVNLYAPFTRADKVTRFNVARLIGGYTDGPGNIEFDPAAVPFSVDENIGTFSAPLRRVDGRLGSASAFANITGNTATVPGDVGGSGSSASWPEYWLVAPQSVGFPGFEYFQVPIVDDNLREGDETFNLSAASVSGSLNLGNSLFFGVGFFGLGGEYIPIGAARGYNDSVRVTIADNEFDRGEFNFAVGNFVVEEGSGQATITIIRTNGSSGPVSVQLFVTDGTAFAGQDYVAPLGPQTLFFPSGVTSNTFSITLINNAQVEPDETFNLVLANATGGAKLPGGLSTSTATATVTIVDDDFLPGRINFSSTNYVANESANQAVVTVTRTGGNLNLLTVQYTTIDGTATAPADYVARSGTLTWNSGDSSPRTIIIPLVADGLVEGDETVGLSLFNPSDPMALGVRTNATLTITDGDHYGTLSFSQPVYTVGENDASPVITVLRTGGVGGTVTVSFATSPFLNTNGFASATNGIDYLDTNGVLTLLPGELSKTFRVPVLDDTDIDGDKFFILTLSNAVNATIGSLSNSVVVLVDNESVSTPAGSLDTAFSDSSSPDGAVYALALQANGSIVMAGDFTEVGSVPRNHIARLLENGTLDQAFDIGPGADGSIRALALQSDGRILVGGPFNTINGTNRSGLARLSIDGKVDTSFDPGAGADNPVLTITVQSDDKVLAGGSFSHFRSFSSPGLVRLNTNGTIDASFNVGAGINGTVYAIEVQSDGKILVGGNFVSFNGISRTNIVRLNADGSLDTGFNPAFSVDAPVRAILAESDGRILIGGSFTKVNDVTRRFLARLEKNGALDVGFLAGPSDGADNVVNVIKQQVDGRLVVGGDFLSFSGVTRHAITRLNDSDGSIDPTINFGAGANAFVAALAIQPDRKILLGGGFTEYDQRPRKYLARIYGGSISGAGTLDFDIPPGSPYVGTFSVSESETNAAVTVRRRGGTAGTVSVHYATTNGTAIASRDYLSAQGDIVFPQGETFRVINVPILQNDIPDGDRTLDLGLSNFIGATPGPQPSATLVIIDDESVIRFTATEYSIVESPVNGSATIGVFRGGGTNRTVSVSFTTVSGTAAAGSDFVSTNGTLVFQPGEVFKNFNVPIIDDALAEGNETLFLQLLNASSGATIIGGDATLVIVDNDFAPGQFQFSANNFNVDETNGSVSVTLLRVNGSSGPASVRLRTSDGTASNILDYIATDRIVNFSDGETKKFVSIPILNDAIFESDEFFNVTLSQPSPGTSVATPNATVTIIDDEFGPSYVGFSSATFLGNELSGLATISVVRTNTRRGVVSVDYSTSDGTATSADYAPTSGTLVFADGEILKTFTVPLVNDGIAESAETVNLKLRNLSSGFLSLSNATLNIVDPGIIVGAGTALIAESFAPANNTIEPGETVTLLLALRNAGVVNANNVSASLVYSNGISYPTAQVQNYGALLAGGNSVSRPFTFSVSGVNGSRITATLLITNNGLLLSPVSFEFVLGAQNAQFQFTNPITINDNSTATPYPSILTISGVSGPVNRLTVTLQGLTHSFPDDLDILLVGPNGAAVMLMSDAGGGQANALNNVTLTFDDAAVNVIPDAAPITSGTYRAANYLTQVDPIPPFPNNTVWSNTSLAVFNGINPNGPWSLYVVDDASGQSGVIANGWRLNIATSDPVIADADLSVAVADSPDPVPVGGVVTYSILVANHGPSAASSVAVTNVLPVEANFIGVSGPGTYTLNGNVLVGSIGSIPMGGAASFVVTMAAPNVGGVMAFDSTVGGGQVDLNTGNNHVTVQTTVAASTPLPALFASSKNGNFVLNWDGTATNVTLQSSTLMNLGGWTVMTNTPVLSNGVCTVTVPMAGGTKFFRLRKL